MANPDPMDFDMNQPEPERARGYDVPLPPELPYRTDVHGQPIIEHWADVTDRYTIRLLDDGSAFEVRELNEDDPTGMGRRFEGDWPKMYPMGPPSQRPDYHPLLEKYGLKILNAAGFINSVNPWEPVNLGPHGRLHGADWRNPTFDPNERIHPVLRFDMWRGISQEDYELMRYSLLLASAVLDDPTILNYFYALMQPVASMETVIDSDTNLLCRIVDIPDVLTAEQQRETAQAMMKMRGWTHWDLPGPACDPPYYLGVTRTKLDQVSACIPAARANTRQTTILVDHGYIKLLRQIDLIKKTGRPDKHNWFYDLQRMSRIPAHKREHIDVISAHARLVFMLACTITHEFVHAFLAAHFDQPWFLPPDTQPLEPWLRGARSNEQGNCFENFVWGGCPRALYIAFPPMSPEFQLRQDQAMPFGGYFDDIWDQWTIHVPSAAFDAVMSSVRPEGLNKPLRRFPIVQEWFQRLCTDDMWLDQVQRFGLDAVKMPKPKYWDVAHWVSGNRGNFGTGEERWNRPDDTAWVKKPPNWL